MDLIFRFSKLFFAHFIKLSYILPPGNAKYLFSPMGSVNRICKIFMVPFQSFSG